MVIQEGTLPSFQHAVQFVGPAELTLNRHKAVVRPGPREVLVRIEAVGLCFSDLKLLNQFTAHPRKSEVLAGVDPEALREMASYVPGNRPTVPGHEVACRVVAVGSAVTHYHVGQRCLVQPDYRALKTKGSNGAFGYNFEGGLQEYVLLDERVTSDPETGERFLIPVPERLGASSVALVEPWSCVEDSYVTRNRKTLQPGGRLLVVAEAGHRIVGLSEALSLGSPPASLTALYTEGSQGESVQGLGMACQRVESVRSLADEAYDDIVYFGSSAETITVLNDKLAAHGVINIVLGGRAIGRPVSVGIGRIHYSATRWIGTTGMSAVEAYASVPASGEIRSGDTILVVGAGGPMGQMHAIRAICSGIQGISVVGADVDDTRLQTLRLKAEPLARANGVPLRLVNTTREPIAEQCSYHIILAPLGALVAASVRDCPDSTLVNVFAGIPAGTRHELDLDRYIARGCFLFGTSGTNSSAMHITLDKVVNGQLDTDSSVDAVCGMEGAPDALAAIENRTLSGKIVVYPDLHDVGLIPLAELDRRFPSVAAKLEHGRWCRAAEEELVRAVSGM